MSIADMLNGLSDIINGVRTKDTPAAAPIPKIPDQLIGAPGVLQTPVLGSEWARQMSVQLPQFAETIAKAPTALYGLADAIPKLWGGENIGLPGAEGARDITQKITTIGENINEWQLDEPRNTNLLSGTPPEIAANWAGLATGALARAPSVVMNEVDKGIKLLEAGKGLAARTAEYTAKGLEMISPVMMRTPTKAIEAGSLGVAGALGAGLELAFPDPSVEAANKEIAKSTDVAMIGGAQADSGIKELKAQTQPVEASILPKTGNETLDAVLPYAAGVAAIFAGYKTNVVQRVLKGMGKNADETMLEGSDLLRRQIVDQTVPMKESYSSVLRSQNNPHADEFSKIMGNKIDESRGAAQDTKMASIFDYGEAAGTSVKSQPVKDFVAKFNYTLSPTEQEQVRRGILSRAPYFDDVAGAARDSATRGADWTAVQSNPKLRAAVDEYDAIARKWLADYPLEQRNITPARHAEIVQSTSLSFPQQLFREGMNPTSKGFKQNVQLSSGGDPIADLPNVIQQSIRQVAVNDVNRTLINYFRQAEDAGDAVAKSFMGRRDVMGVTDKNAQIIHYRDANGVPRSQEFTDPYLYKAMKTGGDISRLHALAGASPVLSGMAKIARGLQSGATGALTAAVGQPFAHIAAFYNGMFGAIMRERGTAAGPLDALAQNLGFKFGIPGDPTIHLQWPLHALEGIAGVFAKRASDAIHTYAVKQAGFGGTINPTAATRMADDLRNFYERTYPYKFQQEALLGPVGMGGVDPAVNINNTVKQMQAAGLPRRAIRETYYFLNDIMHAISAAPGAAVYYNNKNLRPELRARAVRELTGDTSRVGAYEGGFGGTVGTVGSITPWWNVYVQSGDKFLRGLNLNNPKQFASNMVGVTTMVGLPTIAVGAWTAGLDKMYADYAYNKRTPEDMAANLYIPIPGLPPEDGSRIPIDPVMRPYFLAMQVLVGHQLGLFTGEIFKPENAEQRQAFAEMARSRWLGLGSGTVGSAAIDQSVLPPAPPALTAGLAAAGLNFRSYTDVREIHKRNDVGYADTDARNPFRDVMGMHASASAENVVRALGAGAGQLAWDVFGGTLQIAKEGGDVNKMLKRASQQIALGSNDRMRGMSGGLLAGFSAISPSQEAAGTLVSQKLKGMQSMVEAFQATTKGGADTQGDIIGTKQRGFRETQGGPISVTPDDPTVKLLNFYAKQKLQEINKNFTGPNKDDYADRQSLQISTKYSPERKREKMNELSDRIIERNRMALEQLHQFEAQMSNLFKRPIKLEKWNAGKGMEQFSE